MTSYETIFYKLETSMHMGTGTDIGIVDMPIQREVQTNFPKMESSSIKGSFRNIFEDKLKEDDDVIKKLFGGKDDTDQESGSLCFTDGKILLFPVKSAKGIFAWITCPFLLNRFKEDIKYFLNIQIIGQSECLIPQENTVFIQKDENDINSNIVIIDKKNNKTVIIDEFQFPIKCFKEEDSILNYVFDKLESLDEFTKNKLSKDIVILSDQDFKYFVEMSTEINTRIKIGENGVVEEGKLFTEEYLPAETIMYGFISDCEGDNNPNLQKFKDEIEDIPCIQFGGDSTIGKGFTKVITEKGK